MYDQIPYILKIQTVTAGLKNSLQQIYIHLRVAACKLNSICNYFLFNNNIVFKKVLKIHANLMIIKHA